MSESNLFKFIINGQLFLLNLSTLSFKNLQKYLSVQENSIIIEHNFKIQAENNSDSVLINDLDKIEFITLIGGG